MKLKIVLNILSKLRDQKLNQMEKNDKIRSASVRGLNPELNKKYIFLKMVKFWNLGDLRSLGKGHLLIRLKIMVVD